MAGCPAEKREVVTIFIPHWTKLRIDVAIYACNGFRWRPHHEGVVGDPEWRRMPFPPCSREVAVTLLIFTHGPMS